MLLAAGSGFADLYLSSHFAEKRMGDKKRLPGGNRSVFS